MKHFNADIDEDNDSDDENHNSSNEFDRYQTIKFWPSNILYTTQEQNENNDFRETLETKNFNHYSEYYSNNLIDNIIKINSDRIDSLVYENDSIYLDFKDNKRCQLFTGFVQESPNDSHASITICSDGTLIVGKDSRLPV
ncbi:hypothetical protein QR98_0070780 [Sarcoptes scabiei]|uniref:Uncharacterized protein n=1 Tax=Sarcoptes scabiei TaxID=52283 RepID=A0A132AC37_SARSC|nr:hypothetical protein QR98_0070780 [Sarcoptes scabiei]